MNLVTVKTPAEVKLKGITVAFEKKDNALSSVILTDEDGNKMVVGQTYYSSFGVFVPAKPEKKAVFTVNAELPEGAVFTGNFDDKGSAEEKARTLRSTFSISADKVTVEETEAEVLDDGKIVVAGTAEEIPF